MRFKKGIITSTLLVSLLAFTGCSNTGGGKADGKVELRYATWDQTSMEYIDKLVDEYEAENPNVNITVEAVSYSDYWTKMETSAAGGTAPDIFWMNALNISKYAENGMLVSMDDMIKEKNVDMGQYLDALTSLYNYKGEQYAFPTFWDNNVLLINTKLIEEYKISEPKENWNWEEMIAWLEEAKSKLPKDVYPFTSETTNTQSGVFNEVASAGGRIISEDKTKAMLTTPETKDGFKKYYDLVKSDLHSPLDITIELGSSAIFKSEKALVFQAGSSQLLPYSDPEQSQAAGNFKLYPIPTIKEGNETKTIIHGLGNVISANTKHPKEAFDFINFMSTKESMKTYTELALVPQAHKDIQDVFVEVMKEKIGLDTKVMLELAENAMPLPNSLDTSKWDKVMTDNITKFLQDEITLDEALENTQKEMQAILDKEQK